MTDRHQTVVGDHPVFDFLVSFTAKTGKRNLWFVHVIGDDTRAVLVQSIVFVVPGTEESIAPLVEKYHQMVIETVHLP